MNLSDLPTPPLPERLPHHDDDYYKLLLLRYIAKNHWKPPQFNFCFEALQLLNEIDKRKDNPK